MTAKNVKKRLLIIDDEANMRHMLATVLKKADYQVETAADGAKGLEMIQQSAYDFILCDIKMPKMGGMEFLKLSRDRIGAATVIMMSAYGTIEVAVEAMKEGAYDYISKPFKSDEVLITLKKAEERESLKRENRWLKERIKKIQENYSALLSSLIVSVFWALWYLPAFFITDTFYAAMGTGTADFWSFFIRIIGTSFVISWIYNNTGK